MLFHLSPSLLLLQLLLFTSPASFTATPSPKFTNLIHWSTHLVDNLPLIIYRRTDQPDHYVIEPTVEVTASSANSTCVQFDQMTQQYHMDLLITLFQPEYQLLVRQYLRCAQPKSVQTMRTKSLKLLNNCGSSSSGRLWQIEDPIVNSGGDVAFLRVNCRDAKTCRDLKFTFHSGNSTFLQGVQFVLEAESDNSSVSGLVKQLIHRPEEMLFTVSSFTREASSVNSSKDCPNGSLSLTHFANFITDGLPFTVYQDSAGSLWLKPLMLMLVNETKVQVVNVEDRVSGGQLYRLRIPLLLQSKSILSELTVRLAQLKGRTVKFMDLIGYRLVQSQMTNRLKFRDLVLRSHRMTGEIWLEGGEEVREMGKHLTSQALQLSNLLSLSLTLSPNVACFESLTLSDERLLEGRDSAVPIETMRQWRDAKSEKETRVVNLRLVSRVTSTVSGLPLLIRQVEDNDDLEDVLFIDPILSVVPDAAVKFVNDRVFSNASFASVRIEFRRQRELREAKLRSLSRLGWRLQFGEIETLKVQINQAGEHAIFDRGELLMAFDERWGELRLRCRDGKCNNVRNTTSPADIIPLNLTVTFTMKLSQLARRRDSRVDIKDSSSNSSSSSSSSSIPKFITITSSPITRPLTYSRHQLFTLTQITHQLTPSVPACSQSDGGLKFVKMLRLPNFCPVSIWKSNRKPRYHVEPLLCLRSIKLVKENFGMTKTFTRIMVNVTMYNSSVVQFVADELRVKKKLVKFMKVLDFTIEKFENAKMQIDGEWLVMDVNCDSRRFCDNIVRHFSTTTGLISDKLPASLKVKNVHENCRFTNFTLHSQLHRRETTRLPFSLLNSKFKFPVTEESAPTVNCSKKSVNTRLEENGCTVFTREWTEMRELKFCVKPNLKTVTNCFDYFVGKPCFETSFTLSDGEDSARIVAVNVTADVRLKKIGFTIDSFTVNAEMSEGFLRIFCDNSSSCKRLGTGFASSPQLLLEKLSLHIKLFTPVNFSGPCDSRYLSFTHQILSPNRELQSPTESVTKCSPTHSPIFHQWINTENNCEAFVYKLNNNENQLVMEPLLCYHGNSSLVNDYSVKEKFVKMSLSVRSEEIEQMVRDKLGLSSRVNLQWMQLRRVTVTHVKQILGVKVGKILLDADGRGVEVRLMCQGVTCDRLSKTLLTHPTDFLRTLELSAVNQLPGDSSCTFASERHKHLATFSTTRPTSAAACVSQIALEIQRREEAKAKWDRIRRRANRICQSNNFMCKTRLINNTLTLYLFSRTTGTHYSARSSCRSVGAELVVIDSSSENQFVKNSCNQYYNYWIGLIRRSGYRYSYPNWVTGHSPSFTRYASGNGYGRGDNCFYISRSDEKWHESYCSNSQYYICEKKM